MFNGHIAHISLFLSLPSYPYDSMSYATGLRLSIYGACGTRYVRLSSHHRFLVAACSHCTIQKSPPSDDLPMTSDADDLLTTSDADDATEKVLPYDCVMGIQPTSSLKGFCLSFLSKHFRAIRNKLRVSSVRKRGSGARK